MVVESMPVAAVHGEASTEMSFFLAILEIARLINSLEFLDGAIEPSNPDMSIALRRRRLVESSTRMVERFFIRDRDTSRRLNWVLLLPLKATLVRHYCHLCQV